MFKDHFLSLFTESSCVPDIVHTLLTFIYSVLFPCLYFPLGGLILFLLLYNTVGKAYGSGHTLGSSCRTHDLAFLDNSLNARVDRRLFSMITTR